VCIKMGLLLRVDSFDLLGGGMGRMLSCLYHSRVRAGFGLFFWPIWIMDELGNDGREEGRSEHELCSNFVDSV